MILGTTILVLAAIGLINLLEDVMENTSITASKEKEIISDMAEEEIE